MAHATSRDGRFAVVSQEWDSNGSWLVEVVNTERHHNVRGALLSPAPEAIRAARDVARRVDPMGKVRWTRLEKIHHVRTDAGMRVGYRFTASRLGPECK